MSNHQSIGHTNDHYAPIIDADFVDVSESLNAERNAPPAPYKEDRKGPIQPGVLRG